MSTHFNPDQFSRPKRNTTDWVKTKWFPFVATGVGALALGVLIGASGQPEPAAAPLPPALTVTASPTPAPTVTKTVEVAPASCLKALDLSEQGFSYAAEAMGYMGDALTAAGDFNVAGLTKANEDIAVVSPKLKALTSPMKSASAECRAAAK